MLPNNHDEPSDITYAPLGTRRQFLSPALQHDLQPVFVQVHLLVSALAAGGEMPNLSLETGAGGLQGWPELAVVVKPNGIQFWGRCTTHCRTYFSGDWDVHWGYDLDLTHGQSSLGS